MEWLVSLKFVGPAAFAGAVFIHNILASSMTGEPWAYALDIIALAVLFGGFLVVGRLRAALEAEKMIATSWKEEREVALVRLERKEEECLKLKEEVAHLKGRPDLHHVIERLGAIEALLMTQGGSK